MKKIIISPPFGNYLNLDWATSVKGTYTLEKRGGLIKNTLKTFRPYYNGWINNIGLRNKGIRNVEFDIEDNIYSITGFHTDDWLEIGRFIPAGATVEMNISCPNVEFDSKFQDNIIQNIEFFSNWTLGENLIVKLPFNSDSDFVSALPKNVSVHISNTKPSLRGGISGPSLIRTNCETISRIRDKNKHLTIIGGGGIYSLDILRMYEDAGADKFSLSTIFMNPIKNWGEINKIKEYIDSNN
jgi:dihydroorotate dehydrogenase